MIRQWFLVKVKESVYLVVSVMKPLLVFSLWGWYLLQNYSFKKTTYLFILVIKTLQTKSIWTVLLMVQKLGSFVLAVLQEHSSCGHGAKGRWMSGNFSKTFTVALGTVGTKHVFTLFVLSHIQTHFIPTIVRLFFRGNYKDFYVLMYFKII